jgi:hypothetical protein
VVVGVALAISTTAAAGEIRRIEPYTSYSPNWDRRVERVLEWDVTDEVWARSGGGLTINSGDPYWEAQSGTLPLRFGVFVEGTEPTLRNNGVTLALGADPAQDCTYSTCPWPENSVWLTDKANPTSPFTFVGRTDDPGTLIREDRLWVLYPNGCGDSGSSSEAVRDLCDPNAPCLAQCPPNDTENDNQAQLRTTQITGSNGGAGGRWAGTTWIELLTPRDQVGLDVATTLYGVGATDGTARNIRFRFLDANLNSAGVYNIASIDEKVRYNLFFDNDAVRFYFADVNGDSTIKYIGIDSVDGHRVALRRVFVDTSYTYNPAHEIAQALCIPPQLGIHREYDWVIEQWIDPTPHFRSGSLEDPRLSFTHWGDEDGPHPPFPAETWNQTHCYCNPSGGCAMNTDVAADVAALGTTALPNFCDGDFNNDGVVDFVDVPFFAVDQSLGYDSGTGTDMNGDGVVDFVDTPLFSASLTAGSPCP